MAKPLTLTLTKNLGRTIGGGHPWIYRDALAPFEAAAGTIAQVRDRKGRYLATGLVEEGAIGVRVFTTRNEPFDVALLRRRFRAAFDLRSLVVPAETTVYRMCHGEGDRLPGIALDAYGTDDGMYVVLRLDGSAAAAIEAKILEALIPILEERGVTGLMCRIGRRGEAPRCVWGQSPPDQITVRERGMALVADLHRGQKTGLFLDHRPSRAYVRSLAEGLRVLNLYAYTGGFSVAAGLGGATQVTTVDVAPGAIALAEASWAANGLDPARHRAQAVDVRTFLEQDDQVYDLVISDPPSFAPNERSVGAACAAYERLHASCLERVVPGGLFLAASCSSHVQGEAFDDTVRRGAARAGRILQLLHRGGAPADHPRLLAFPEGDYLDVVFTRTIG